MVNNGEFHGMIWDITAIVSSSKSFMLPLEFSNGVIVMGKF
jgi:hypothetical protein